MATQPVKSVSRSAALEMFLEAVNARCVSTFEDSCYRLQLFTANGRVLIVQHFKTLAGRGCFEVFVPSSDVNNVAAALDAARNFLVTGNVQPAALAACEELIRGDGGPDSQQRAIEHARVTLGLVVVS